MDKKHEVVYKPIGRTPLEVVEEYKSKFNIPAGYRVSYAGRLDPMACGVMILLLGEETKKREEYQKLDKTYEFKAVFGFSSDTYDLLGIANSSEKVMDAERLKGEVLKFLKIKLGKHYQQYPVYSSKAVNGKKLFEWAKEGRLNEIEMPGKDVEVYSFELLSFEKISSELLLKNIVDRIGKVKGDFRQDKILEMWNGLLNKKTEYLIGSFSIKASSGFYVRSVVNEMGQFLGTKAVTYEIKRTSVGKFGLGDCLRVFGAEE